MVVKRGGMEDHQVGGFELHPAGRKRMLDGLVLSDRPAENHALFGVAGSTLQRRAADADRLRRDQDALRIHPVQDVLETAALFADAVFDRYAQSVDEQLIRIDGLAAHLFDLAHLDKARSSLV